MKVRLNMETKSD